jgi:hypothetical protein
LWPYQQAFSHMTSKAIQMNSIDSEQLEPLNRRRVVFGLAGLSAATFLPGCGGSQGTDAGVASGADFASSTEDHALAVARPGFVHPGLLHTEADFSRMRAKVFSATQPWEAGWRTLLGSSNSGPGPAPRPQATIVRGIPGDNYGATVADMLRAYQNALHWKITGDVACADYAVRILNAWSSTLNGINGDTSVFLVAGLGGYQWANAAEIMRTYPGWALADVKRFQDMLLRVFYPVSSSFLKYQNDQGGNSPSYVFASWDLMSAAAILAIGVFCDRQDLYDEAISYYKSGRGSGTGQRSVYFLHPGYLGQWQESGRDQGHSTLGITVGAALCEMAWNQGEDLYGFLNNRFLAGAEYVAASNLKDQRGNYYSLPFSAQHSEWGSGGAFTSVSDVSRGAMRPGWEAIYHHYVNRKGLSAPYVTAMAAAVRAERSDDGGDGPGLGTLTFSRESFSGKVAPSGLTAVLIDGNVRLSWWGCVGASVYYVMASGSPNGPFSAIATVNEPRTYLDKPSDGTWYYQITATRGGAMTGPSNVVGITVLNAVPLSPKGTGADGASRATVQGQPLLMLQMNEGIGTVATDLTAGRNAVLRPGVGWGEGRTAGTSAVAIAGNAGYVELPADLTSQLGDFTLALWVNANYEVPGARLVFIGSHDANYMAIVPCYHTDHHLKFVITGTGLGGEQMIEAPSGLPIRRWVHVAVTMRGSTGRIYVDGKEVGSNGSVLLSPFQLGPAINGAIGGGFGFGNFSGRVLSFRLHNRALTPEEVATLAT